MNRRGFLGTLLASVGALTIDPATLLWQPPESTDGLPVLEAGAMVDLDAITKAMAEEVERLWQARVVRPFSKLGQGDLTRQVYITMLPPDKVDRYGLDRQRYVLPAASAMADYLRHYRASQCGVLDHPPGAESVVVRREGLSLRGVRYYDLYTDQRLLRFDIVYG